MSPGRNTEEKRTDPATEEGIPDHVHSSEVPGPAPLLHHPQGADFAMETVLPPSSAPKASQCTLGNAVHLCSATPGTSPLRGPKRLHVPVGRANTRAVSGDKVSTEGPEPPNGQPPGRSLHHHWLRWRGGGGVSGMRRGAVRRSRC